MTGTLFLWVASGCQSDKKGIGGIVPSGDASDDGQAAPDGSTLPSDGADARPMIDSSADAEKGPTDATVDRGASDLTTQDRQGDRLPDVPVSTTGDGSAPDVVDSSIPNPPPDGPGGCVKRQCGVQVACGTTDDGCGGTVTCEDCAPVNLHALTMRVAHVLCDAPKKRLYATVMGDDPNYPNSLVTVDLPTMSIVDSVPVGSNPGDLAMSDDGSTLWLAITGSSAARRVDLTSTPYTVGPLRHLMTAQRASSTVGNIVMLPGLTDSFAALFGGAAVIFDDGVARASDTQGHGFITSLTRGPGNLLFGFYYTSPWTLTFHILTVTPAGVSTMAYDGLADGTDSRIVYGYNRVYPADVEQLDVVDAIDVSDPSKPVRAGQFKYSGSVLPRASGNVTMVSMYEPPYAEGPTLRKLDSTTFSQISSAPITSTFPTRIDSQISDLCLIAPDTVAFMGWSGNLIARHVFFLKDELIRE